MRKVFSYLIIIGLIIIYSQNVNAAGEIYSEGDFVYEIRNGGVVITGYYGSDQTIIVPSMIAGYPVSEIASGAFEGTNDKELVLPQTIMTISPNAISFGCDISYTDDEFIFRIKDGKAIIIDYTGEKSECVLPEEIAGLPVSNTSLEFDECDEIADKSQDSEHSLLKENTKHVSDEAAINEAEDLITDDDIPGSIEIQDSPVSTADSISIVFAFLLIAIIIALVLKLRNKGKTRMDNI